MRPVTCPGGVFRLLSLSQWRMRTAAEGRVLLPAETVGGGGEIGGVETLDSFCLIKWNRMLQLQQLLFCVAMSFSNGSVARHPNGRLWKASHFEPKFLLISSYHFHHFPEPVPKLGPGGRGMLRPTGGPSLCQLKPELPCLRGSFRPH